MYCCIAFRSQQIPRGGVVFTASLHDAHNPRCFYHGKGHIDSSPKRSHLCPHRISYCTSRLQFIRLGSKSKLFRHSQTWITILKCPLDSALVSLLTLDTLKGIDGGKQKLVRMLHLLKVASRSTYLFGKHTYLPINYDSTTYKMQLTS